ncbi:uncharacterized protein LOC130653811 [Hydractinia symbiolongicarpus]|uniref:uncharacterized protein LOC130653811 n=1 Tax=Hydractinia symbiolongicarpus TaxID=13093 RepID=UPI00254F399F|nr:uncharacterized protein LOC130653811 [Hydractinia symbiolongicarpus]
MFLSITRISMLWFTSFLLREKFEDVMERVAPLLFENYLHDRSDPFILKFINPNIRQTRVKKNSKLDIQSEVDVIEPAVAIQTQNIKLRLKAITEMKNSTVSNNTSKEVTIQTTEYIAKTKCTATEGTDTHTVEKVVLATALGALRSKRRNSKAFSASGIVTNEGLNDINLLMKVLQDKEQLDDVTNVEILQLVNTLREELMLNEIEQVHAPRDIRMNLIPSPMRRDMVPGVAGERIVSKLRVLPKIDTVKKSQVNRMKAIPERHGNATVFKQNGHTKYGLIQFHWTTYTPRYDMDTNEYCRSAHQNKPVNKPAKVAVKKQEKNQVTPRLPFIWKRRLNNTPISCRPSGMLNNHTVLPAIEAVGKDTKMSISLHTLLPL